MTLALSIPTLFNHLRDLLPTLADQLAPLEAQVAAQVGAGTSFAAVLDTIENFLIGLVPNPLARMAIRSFLTVVNAIVFSHNAALAAPSTTVTTPTVSL